MKIKAIAAWAHVNKPSKASIWKDESGVNVPIASSYSINLLLDGKTAKALDAEGVDVKKVTKEITGLTDSVGKPYVIAKTPATYKEGGPARPPVCVDAKTKPYTGLIGNGSTVIVEVQLKPWSKKIGKTVVEGTSVKLLGVQVLELVEVKSEVVFDVHETGFEAEESTQNTMIGTTQNTMNSTAQAWDEEGFN